MFTSIFFWNILDIWKKTKRPNVQIKGDRTQNVVNVSFKKNEIRNRSGVGNDVRKYQSVPENGFGTTCQYIQ